MPDDAVCVSGFGLIDEALLRAICEALAEHGIRVASGPSEGGASIHAVLFAEVDDEFLSFIDRRNRGGAVRVMAVAVGERTPPPDEEWRLLHAGASEVVRWAGGREDLEAIVARMRRWLDIEALLAAPVVRASLAGHSRVWQSVLRRVIELGRFGNGSVLLAGESGTGKEVLARLIHAIDSRPNKRHFVVVDCTTIVPELSGSELFGHERGAFTTAIASRDGAFALADQGTLFLDEIGELPLRIQAELLRVIQERTFKRVGSNSWQRTDFRLVCATNRDLRQELAQGRFREDLYYRLAAATCTLPPLRDHREDILELTRYFLNEIYRGRAVPLLDPAVRDYLAARDYSGNVRQLRQLIGRMADRYVGVGPLTIGTVPEEEWPSRGNVDGTWPDARFESAVRDALGRGKGLEELRSVTADTAFRIVAEEEAGDTNRMAERLRISMRAVQMRLRQEESPPRPCAGLPERTAAMIDVPSP